MAEIIKAQPNSKNGSATINPQTAFYTAQAGQSIGNALLREGQSQAADQTGAITNDLGTSIAAENVKQLEEVSNSIQNSIYADRMSRSTKEFLMGSQQRASTTTDKEGNPTFGSLVEDVGKLGKDTLAKYLDGVSDPVIRQKLTANFEAQVAQSQLQTMTTAKKQQGDFAAASYAELKDTTMKQAGLDKADNISMYMGRLQEVLAGNVSSGLLSAEEAKKELLNTERTLKVDHVQQSIDSDPYSALDSLSSDKGELGLSSTDVRDLKHSAETKVAKIEAQKKAQEAALKEQYTDLFKQVQDFTKEGVDVSKEMKDYLRESTKGTALEKDVDKLIANNEVVSKFSAQSMEDQKAWLDAAKAQGGSIKPEYAETYGLMQKAYKAHQDAIKEDAAQYAVDRNLMPEAAPLDVSQGDAGIAAQVSKIYNDSRAAEAAVGKKITGMTKEYAKQIIAVRNQKTPEEKAKFDKLMSGIYGEAAYRTHIGDIAKAGDEDTAWNMQLSELDSNLAITANVGKQALKDKLTKRVSPDIGGPGIAEATSSVGNSSLQAYMADTIYNVTAQRSAQSGEDGSILISEVAREVSRTQVYNGRQTSFFGVKGSNEDAVRALRGIRTVKGMDTGASPDLTAADQLKQAHPILMSPGVFAFQRPDGTFILDSTMTDSFTININELIGK